MLGEIGGSAVERLINALYSNDSQVRYTVALALGQMKSKAAVPDLMKRLDDVSYVGASGKRVCDAAADALERIGTEEALNAAHKWTRK